MALTPVEYSDMGPKLSAAFGLPEQPHGLLCCVDEETGERWSLITPDTGYLAVAASPEQGEEVHFDPAKFPRSARGWPDDWGV